MERPLIKNFLYEELGDLYCSPSFSPSDRDQYLSTITSGMGNEQLLKLFDYLLANGRYRAANYLPENQSIHYDYVNKPVDFRFSHEGEEFKPVDFRFSHEGEEFSRDVPQEEDYLLLLQPGSWPLSTDFKDQLTHIFQQFLILPEINQKLTDSPFYVITLKT